MKTTLEKLLWKNIVEFQYEGHRQTLFSIRIARKIKRCHKAQASESYLTIFIIEFEL